MWRWTRGSVSWAALCPLRRARAAACVRSGPSFVRELAREGCCTFVMTRAHARRSRYVAFDAWALCATDMRARRCSACSSAHARPAAIALFPHMLGASLLTTAWSALRVVACRSTRAVYVAQCEPSVLAGAAATWSAIPESTARMLAVDRLTAALSEPLRARRLVRASVASRRARAFGAVVSP